MADGNHGSQARKRQPIALGVFAYFPKTLAALAECSLIGNEKHAPGQPLQWSKDASTDDADAAARHLVDAVAYGPLVLNDDRVPHVIAATWRMLAFSERALTGDDRWWRGPHGSEFPEPARAKSPLETTPMNVPHSPEFFQQMTTCREAYARLGIAFSQVLPQGCTVLDFGCGTGHQTACLARLGYKIVGVDPLADPSLVEAGFLFIQDDPIRDEIDADDVFDVVICTEVAEHIYPERADALIASICKRARSRVIFSAARPGQQWEGHVNCQEIGYWLFRFADHGFEVSDDATVQLRAAMIQHNAQHCGAVENFVVLDRAEPAPLL